MSREVLVLSGALLFGSAALAVGVMGSGRFRLSPSQLLVLAAMLLTVLIMTMIELVLPAQPAALVAVLAMAWLIGRAAWPVIGNAISRGERLEAVLLAMAVLTALVAIAIGVWATHN